MSLEEQAVNGSATILKEVEDTIKAKRPGSIIHLQHDTLVASAETLDAIIDMVQAAQYRIVSLEECIHGRGIVSASTAFESGDCQAPAPPTMVGSRNCSLSAWSEWTACSTASQPDCASGIGSDGLRHVRRRVRMVAVAATGPNGACDAELEQEAPCSEVCPATCGDGTCSGEEGDTCSDCPMDCGVCGPAGTVTECIASGTYALAFDDGPTLAYGIHRLPALAHTSRWPVPHTAARCLLVCMHFCWDSTEVVLDALAASGVKATFFVMGSQVDMPLQRPIFKRAVAEGHTIGM